MSIAISPVTSPSATLPQSTKPASSPAPGGLADQSTFLTLLVTQLKNQNPASPADSTQFVTQLAQFSQLEDLQNINKNVMKISDGIAAGAASSAAPVSAPTTTP